MKRIAMNYKRVCLESLISCLSGNVSDKEVLEVSGDESDGDCGCDECVCVPACVPSVPILFSLVDMVCVLDRLSVSDFEVARPQILSAYRKRGNSVALEREQHKRATGIM